MQYIEKDITTVDFGIVAHGVNCQGAMGSGVAKAIKEKWPQIYVRYLQAGTGETMLGAVDLIDVKPDTDQLFVANCYTQLFYGNNGRFANEDAIAQALDRVMQYAAYYNLPVYLPKIGAGLGGLDWEKEVEPIILWLDNIYRTVDIFVCTFNSTPTQ